MWEIAIPAVIKSATVPAFGITIPLNFILKAGWSLKASTEIGNTFNVIADAQDFAYYASSVRSETTKYTVIMLVQLFQQLTQTLMAQVPWELH